MGQEDGKYIYCIIKETNPKKFEILGQEGRGVYCIAHKGLAAVVSDSELKDYSFVREYLLCHQKVIEHVMSEGYDVLPVRFGTVAQHTKDIEEKILQEKKNELQEEFKQVEGRVELGLRAFWEKMSDIFQELVAEHSEIQKAKQEAKIRPNQFRVAAVGELVARALEQKRAKEAENILNPLKKLAADFKERQRMGDSMILSFAFLVPKKNEKAFDEKMRELRKMHEPRIRFTYVGPLPPFNFVELRLIV